MVAGTILMFEDDEHILQLLTDILTGDGHDVIGLRYLDLVLEVVGNEQPDPM